MKLRACEADPSEEVGPSRLPPLPADGKACSCSADPWEVAIYAFLQFRPTFMLMFVGLQGGFLFPSDHHRCD